MKSAHLKAKGQRPHTNKQIDGKVKADDPYFKYNMTILVGSSAEVRTRDGEVYEGIYVAFSSKMEILLEAAHLVTDNKDDDSIEKHFDVLVIPSEKVISMKCVNADLTYPTREFATDTAISSGRGGGMGSKELTPWECSEDTPEELTLEAGTTTGGGNTVGNGWEAKDMFKKNEEKYGVVSTFNHDLSGYTTKVDKNDTEFKRLEEQANQIAQEIEKGTASWDKSQVENGDEEEAFSAVVRPRNNASSTSVNNNNNNNTSSVGNGKYIPPSRRNNLEPSAPPPSQSHPPQNNNGPAHTNNNSSMNRKPIYNQNQNPRNNYGAPPNAVYHQDRRNFDSRRAPPPNQYGNAPNHVEVRRPEDSGPRPRMPPNKVPSERRDPAKLKEFSNNFRLPSDTSQMRRPPGNPPPPQVGMSSHVMAPNSTASTRNPSPPTSAVPISSNKIIKKEESASAASSLPPLIPPNTSSESMNPPSDSSSLASTNSSATTTSASSAVSTIASPSTPVVANVSVSESTPTSTRSLASPPDNQTPSSASDLKAVEAESKKKFAFNPNAKEFNPKSFASRSPSTPPRPPSTPATVATPQIPMAAQPQIHQFMPLASMQPIFINQQYAQAALTPSSNSSTSSGVTTPRHGGHRKGGMVGIPPRSDMTPPIQMTAGPPILTPATTIQAPPQYFVSQGPYNVMRVVPQGIPVFQPESSGGSQMHPPVHFLPPNQNNPQNNAGHQQNQTPPSNQNQQTNVVPSNGHGYGQAGGSHSGSHHMGYLPAGVPVVYGFGPPGPPIVQQVPFVPHQGGTTTVIPQSQ